MGRAIAYEKQSEPNQLVNLNQDRREFPRHKTTVYCLGQAESSNGPGICQALAIGDFQTIMMPL